MSGDDQSVLRLRLATLKRNLTLVKETDTSVAQRRADVRVLADLFDDSEGIQLTRKMVQDLRDCVDTVKEFADKGLSPQYQTRRLQSNLQNCLVFAEGLLERADHSEKVVRMMERRWEGLSSDKEFDAHISEIFEARAKGLITTIDNLANALPADAWFDFQENIREKSASLFSEYVEFLGGVALRDTGLGEPKPAEARGDPDQDQRAPFAPDVYALADDLVRRIYLIGQRDLWHSLTIPAGRDAAGTLARMVRFRFPEWTVWAVPLAAHEFGRVVVDLLDMVDEYATKSGGAMPGMSTLAADVFGTYSLGPAYAYASIYILLDPRVDRSRPTLPNSIPDSPVRTDSERAYVVLGALDMMNKDGILTDTITALRTRWDTAVEQASGTPTPTGDPADELDDFVRSQVTYLRDKAPTIEFAAERWEKVDTWDPLGKLVKDPDWEGLNPSEEDVRDILNAAWRQRKTCPPLDIGTDAELADAALVLWRGDLERRRHFGPGDKKRRKR